MAKKQNTQWQQVFPSAPGITVDGTNPLNIIDITGEPGTGKTTFGMRAIGPANGKNPILVYDLEQGALPYQHQFAIDIQEIETSSGAKAWQAFADSVDSLESGRYAIAIIDPIEDLEVCLGDWVMDHPEKFNRSPGQYKNGAGVSGLYWGDVKAEAKSTIIALARKVQTVILVRHLGSVYQGSKIVPGSTKPKGKETITFLSTLSAWLVKAPGSAIPSAFIRKSRASFADPSEMDEYGVAQTYPVFPNFIPEFTPAKVRSYLLNPRKKFLPEEMIETDPGKRPLSEVEIIAMKGDLLAAEQEVQTEAKRQRKNALAHRMKSFFQDGELSIAVSDLAARGITFDANEAEFERELQLIGRAQAAARVAAAKAAE